MIPSLSVRSNSIGIPSAGSTESRSADEVSTAQLLPAPDSHATANVDDLFALYALMSQAGAANISLKKDGILANQKLRESKIKEFEDAMRQAQEASANKSFWDDVGSVFSEAGKIACVVSSVALAVASCGAATPIAALAITSCVLSSAALVEGEFQVLESMGVDHETAGWVSMGFSAASALTGGASALLSTASATGQAASTIESLAGTVSQAGTATAAVSSVGAGVSSIHSAVAESDCKNREADAKVASNAESRLSRATKSIIDAILEADTSDRRSLEKLRGAMQLESTVCESSVMRG